MSSHRVTDVIGQGSFIIGLRPPCRGCQGCRGRATKLYEEFRRHTGHHVRAVYSVDGFADRGGPASPSGRAARRLAALRLSGLEPHRVAARRAWQRRERWRPGAGTYLVPASGAPAGWCTRSNATTWMTCRARSASIAGREQLAAGLHDLLEGPRSASPWNTRRAMPFPTSRASMRERSRPCGSAARRSSRRAISRSGSRRSGPTRRWLRTCAAAERLYRIKDRAFDLVRQRIAAGAALTEIEVQDAMVGVVPEEGLIADTPPNVSAQENAGNPHYQATAADPPGHSSQRRRAHRSLG